MSNSLFRKKAIDKILKDAEEGLVDEQHHHSGLKKVLNVRDLTFMGIAAVVGAGIFSTIGAASSNGGPGISLLFVITAITCGFSALCYAEFASRVPIAGSAYTYAYVSFGELIAWIIGWALILEYAIGNIVVAISWSSYFNHLLEGITAWFQTHGFPKVNLALPPYLVSDPSSARTAYEAAARAGRDTSHLAWTLAPQIGSLKLIINIPAFIIVLLISSLTYVGIRESKKSANFMVIFKIAVIIFVIVMGFFYVNSANWNPFLPNGFQGVLMGVSAVFYAYIGFDAISTTAEECRNPQRDLPRGMIYSLLICTVLYILIALVLTGMVHFSELNVNDPLAYVFERIGKKWISYIVAVSAVVATTSVLLVFQLGQPRIWMSMSRDGLLPAPFARLHSKYHTPYFSTIVTGIMVAVPSLFMPSNRMTDLTSIGTLFAFVLVSGGVLMLPKANSATRRGFRLPYINGKIIVPVMYAAFVYLMSGRVEKAFQNLSHDSLQEVLFLVYILVGLILSALTFIKNYSLIPVLGVLSCAYLLIEIPAISWIWFFCWMAIGLTIYFFYGYRKSRLRQE